MLKNESLLLLGDTSYWFQMEHTKLKDIFAKTSWNETTLDWFFNLTGFIHFGYDENQTLFFKTKLTLDWIS